MSAVTSLERVVESAFPRRIRAERLIAMGRLVLAVFSLLALWLDPSEPARFAQVATALLALYLVYAGGITAVAWLSFTPPRGFDVVTHASDLALFSLLIALTGGPTSPFFAYLTFSLVAATLRWGWRGVAWTALAALIAFGAIALHASRAPTFALNRVIIRSAYLTVLAAMLGYAAAYESRLRAEIAGLAAWPRSQPAEQHDAVAQVLQGAARVLGVERVLLAWEDPDEPWVNLAL